MRSKTLLITLTLLIFASLLSGCFGGSSGATVASSWPGLTADGGLVYLASGQHVYAIDHTNGTEQWRFPAEVLKGAEFYAPPALTQDGQLIIASFNHTLYSVDAATGVQKWVFEDAEDRYIAKPLVTDTAIYAPSSDGNLYALDLNGKRLWTLKTEGAIWAPPTTYADCECVYVTSMDHHVYVADSDTGRLLWKSDDLGGSIISSPTLDEQDMRLVVGTFGKEVIALNLQDGAVEWRVPTDGWVWSSPLLVDGALYFGDGVGNFYSLSAADGSQNWKIQPSLGSPIVGTPILVDATIYFTTEKQAVYGVNAEGGIVSTFNVEAKLYSSPVWVDGKLLVAEMGGDALLTALNENGAPQWLFTPSTK